VDVYFCLGLLADLTIACTRTSGDIERTFLFQMSFTKWKNPGAMSPCIFCELSYTFRWSVPANNSVDEAGFWGYSRRNDSFLSPKRLVAQRL